MTAGFFSWRWAPAVLLVLGASALSLAAIVFIPDSIGAAPAKPARAAAASEARDDRPSANEEVARVTITTPAPRRPARPGGDSIFDHRVESFFPVGPGVELPAPLSDDPVPPEPADTAVNRDAIGRGVEPASTPPP